MSTATSNSERVLAVVDPVSCGEAALRRALDGLNPDHQSLTILVVAKNPPTTQGYTMPTSGFAYAEAALGLYRRVVEEAGYKPDGWVTPDRRDQIVREVESSGPYDHALAVSPSGVRRRFLKQDMSLLLESIGVDTTLACAR